LTGGDPKRAPKILRQFGCAACHTISNIPSPGGLAGPELSAMSERVYIAGVLPNTPENLVGWIANPQIAKPGSAMPVTGISENEAKDAAAYLLSLR
jgi:cytochrome c1